MERQPRRTRAVSNATIARWSRGLGVALLFMLTAPLAGGQESGLTLWANDRHPESAFGKGTCDNLSGGDPVEQCHEKCTREGCDFFWVYTEGTSRGRCCPKTWAMYDPAQGMRAFPGGATYAVRGPRLWTRMGYHPESAFGQGSCVNLSAEDAVFSCFSQCRSQGCDWFWVYTEGQNAGRCCPKTWAMFDADQGFRAVPTGGSFKVTEGPPPKQQPVRLFAESYAVPVPHDPNAKFFDHGPGTELDVSLSYLIWAGTDTREGCLETCLEGRRGPCLAAVYHDRGDSGTCRLFKDFDRVVRSSNPDYFAYVVNVPQATACPDAYLGMPCDSDSQCGTEMACKTIGQSGAVGSMLGVFVSGNRFCMARETRALNDAVETGNKELVTAYPLCPEDNRLAAAVAASDGEAIVFGTGVTLGTGSTKSEEFGVVFGPDDRAGYYATSCAGVELDVAVGVYSTLGFYGRWDDIPGLSSVTAGGVSIPLAEGSYTASQVWSSEEVRLVGTQAALGVGAGLNPLVLSAARCSTSVLQVLPDVQFFPGESLPTAQRSEEEREAWRCYGGTSRGCGADCSGHPRDPCTYETFE